jgi:hypothetical protein
MLVYWESLRFPCSESASRIAAVAKRPCTRTTLSGEKKVSSTGSREVRSHRVGLEQVPISVNIFPSPADRSSPQTDLFVEKDAAF